MTTTTDDKANALRAMTTLDALRDLTSDGDTAEIEGVTYRLRVEPDDLYFTDLAEWGDCYGHTQWVRGRDDWQSETGRSAPRPDGFDGNAEIIIRDGSDALWWQPDPEGGKWRGRDPEAFAVFRRNVRDICEYGFAVYVLERLEGEDAYGRPVVAAFASVGGVEPFAEPDYVRSIVADLFGELD